MLLKPVSQLPRPLGPVSQHTPTQKWSVTTVGSYVTIHSGPNQLPPTCLTADSTGYGASVLLQRCGRGLQQWSYDPGTGALSIPGSAGGQSGVALALLSLKHPLTSNLEGCLSLKHPLTSNLEGCLSLKHSHLTSEGCLSLKQPLIDEETGPIYAAREASNRVTVTVTVTAKATATTRIGGLEWERGRERRGEGGDGAAGVLGEMGKGIQVYVGVWRFGGT